MVGVVYVTFPYPFHFQDVDFVIERAAMARHWCVEMLNKGYWPICPILLYQCVADFDSESPPSWGDFREYIMPMMESAEAVQILMFKGWEESANIADEIQYAKAHGKVINYVNTEALEDYRKRMVDYLAGGAVREAVRGSIVDMLNVQVLPLAEACDRGASSELCDAESLDGGLDDRRPDGS